MGKVRFGIIGVGGIAKIMHIEAIKNIQDAELVAVADINEVTARKIGGECGVDWYTDYRDLISRKDIDAIDICTPHSLHPPIAIDSMKTGKHVLTEKPIASTVSDADRMVIESKKCGVILGVVYQNRTVAKYLKAKEMIKDGRIGNIHRAELTFTSLRTQAYYDSSPWRGTWNNEGGGVLVNQAPHSLDIFQFLVGMPIEIYGFIDTIKHRIEVEDIASAILRFPNGAHGFIHVNTVESPSVDRIEICGDNGKLILNNKLLFGRPKIPLSEFISMTKETWKFPECEWKEIEISQQEEGHKAVIQDFVNAILTHGKPMVTGEEGLKSVEIANAIILSGKKKKVVTLPIDRIEYVHLLEEMCSSDIGKYNLKKCIKNA
ncbi:MAG: Gfo/Idh/MocA family oxidoreductase [Planctomycetes bacterium]|nr:Gfo/Idh/MocA family oxidoreductase [Planctomycetota bacterium]